MFDIDSLRSDAIAKVEAAFVRCRDGRFTGDRGCKASAVLLDEAQTIVARHLRDAFQFDPNDFPAYVEAFPLLPGFHGSGDIAQSIAEAVKWHVQRSMESDLIDVVMRQHSSRRLSSFLDDFETAISNTLNLIPQLRGHRIERLMQACRDGAGETELRELQVELRNQAEELHRLIHRLDIADTPTADLAGRGRRLLLEALDLIELTLRRGSVADFCAASVEFSP